MDVSTATQPSVTIGGRVFLVSTVTTEFNASTYLTGPGGGVYYLRPYSGEDTGHREIISLKTGAALRIRGNAVRATHIGDVIEQA